MTPRGSGFDLRHYNIEISGLTVFVGLRRNWNPPVLTNFAGDNVIITEQDASKDAKLSEWQTKAMQALNLDTTKMVFADISKVNRVVPRDVLAKIEGKVG